MRAPAPKSLAFAGALAAGLLLSAGGCGNESARSRELPPLALQPLLPELNRLAQQEPEPPGADRMAQLRELMEAAWLPGYAEARLAAMARRSLLDEEDVGLVLEEGLRHEHPAVRSNAATQLGVPGRRAAVVPLLLRLRTSASGPEYEHDPSVLPSVVDALCRLDNHAGLDQLAELMNRDDTAQQAGVTAIEILRRHGRDPGESPTWTELQQALRDLHRRWLDTGVAPAQVPAAPSDPEPTTAAEEPGEPPGPDALTTARIAQQLILLQGQQLRDVDNARFVLARMGAVVLPLLTRAAGASEVFLRAHSLEILHELGRSAAPAADVVLSLLGDPVSEPDAIRVLGAIGARQALPHLLARLESLDNGLRASAAGALGPLGDQAAIPPLRAILADENESLDVRVQAAFSIALLDPGLPFLEQRLELGDYHEPTIRELIDAIAAKRRGGR